MTPLQDGSSSAAVPRIRISADEKRVLDVLLDTGPGNAEIARRLTRELGREVKEETVKTHMRRLLAKTGCATRTHLAVTIMRDRVKLFVHPPRRLSS